MSVFNFDLEILTNGIKYRFYTDLVEPNMMDDKPFLEFDITDIKDTQIQKRLQQMYFFSSAN